MIWDRATRCSPRRPKAHAAFVLCEYNLIRREWHAAAIDKRHECPGRTVLHDR